MLLAFLVLVPLGVWLFPPHEHVGWFLGYVWSLTAILILICWRKGEPPHWGGKGDEHESNRPEI